MSFKDARLGRGLASVETSAHRCASARTFVRVTLGGDLSAFPGPRLRSVVPPLSPARRRRDELRAAGPVRTWCGYLRYLALGSDEPATAQLRCARGARTSYVDPVVHGDEGVASCWCRARRRRAAPPGTRRPARSGTVLRSRTRLAPAVMLGILRDLPRDARGSAFVEIADPGDAQEYGRPRRRSRCDWVVRPRSVTLRRHRRWTAVRAIAP